jgi:choline dehydrogenase-like flavoprotein
MTAHTLACAGQDVLLLDAGPYHEPVDRPAFSLHELRNKYWNRGLTFTTGSPKIIYAMGYAVGGGSEVNNGEFPSLPKAVLDRWKTRFGLQNISSEELAGHREYCLRKLGAAYEKDEPPAAARLRAGAAAYGWQIETVPRCYNSHSGQAMSLSKTLIPEALDAGCRLLPGARVERLRRRQQGWQLDVDVAGQRQVMACKTVFLCAGAVQSPMILLRSGLGQRVGRLFQSQPMIKVTARFSDMVNDKGMGIPSLQVKQFAPDLTLGCSVSTPAYMALNLLPHGLDHARFKSEWKQYANYYVMLAPEGVGRIRPLPFIREPLLPYRLTDGDLAKLHDGLQKLYRLLLSAGAERLFPSIADCRFLVGDMSDVGRLPPRLPRKTTQLTAVHLSSGCPMGENREHAVVDSFGRVFDTDGLIVSDCSIMCTAPSVNPQATIMALARRNAQQYLGR